MASRALAILIAMTFCFALNRRFTFNHSRTDGIFAQYCRYVGSCSIGAVISWTISVSLTEEAGLFALHPLIAAMAGIAAGLIFNFTIALCVLSYGKTGMFIHIVSRTKPLEKNSLDSSR